MSVMHSQNTAQCFPLSSLDLASPGIVVNGTWYPPLAYTSYLPQTRFYQSIAECGIHLFSFPAYLAARGINIYSGIGPFRKELWQEDGSLNFSDIHADFAKILEADPEAMVIMRLHLDVPEWWEQRFPEACCQLADGTTLRQSFFSTDWREAVGTVLKKIIDWLAKSPYAPHLAGIHIAAGGTEEWFYHYFTHFLDANPSRLTAFEEYLKQKYPEQSTREHAWRNSNAKTPQDALNALAAEREQRWRDPENDAAAFDALRFHSLALVDAIRGFCRIVKQTSNRRLLTGVFYGYHFYVCDARKGHTALSCLLESEDVDYIASPNMYERSPGYDWPPMAAVDSVRLHRKLWMAENDTRTALTRPLAESAPNICPAGQYQNGVWKGPADLQTSAALLRANAARMLTHGYGGWWFDMWGGWFEHPALLAELRTLQKTWPRHEHSEDARKLLPNTLCVILDERLIEEDASFGTLCNPIFRNRFALSHCGRPYMIYLRNDLPLLDLKETPLLWLLGCRNLSESEQALLDVYTENAGAVMHTDDKATRLITAKNKQPAPVLPLTLTVADLRAVLCETGVHCWLESDDVFYMGRGFMAVHAAVAGNKQIKLPGKFKYEQISPAENKTCMGESLDFAMQLHETRIWRITFPD